MRISALFITLLPFAFAAPLGGSEGLALRDAQQPADVALKRDYNIAGPAGRAIIANNRAFDLVARGMPVKRAPLGSGAAVTASSGTNKIKALQYLLVNKGQNIAVDGSLGAGTTAAIKAFQSAQGLSVDGSAGPATLGALVSTVQSGSSGNVVKAAQAALNANGASLAVDGEFGSGTKSATVSFQSSKGLSADGVIGPNTWTALFGGSSGGGGGGGGGGDVGSCSSVKSGVEESGTVVAASNIRVHKCLAPAIKKLVAAAAADGVTLTANSSWRSPASQIALRKQNCGTSHYAIYQMPSSSCSPPTAIPGTSNHERGLAIDFANCQKGTKVFNWLKAHAATYGLYNLPSESWHWSVNGN